MTLNARSFPISLRSKHAVGTRCPAAWQGAVFALRGLALAALFSARPAVGADLTVDQSAGNSPYTVSSDLNYDNIHVGEYGIGVINQSSNFVDATNIVLGDELSNSGNTITYSNGTYNLSGSGSVFAQTLQVGYEGYGTFNQEGGNVSVTTGLTIGTLFTGATGVYNLDGGTLLTSQIGQAPSAMFPGAFGELDFNGGTLTPGVSSNTDFIRNLTAVYVRNGGAIINTANFTGPGPGVIITINQALLHSNKSGDNAIDGGLILPGNGSLTLTATNTYTGGTTVKAGTLIESNNGSALSSGTVSIASGAIVALNNTSTSTQIYQEGTTFSGAGTLQKTGAGPIQFGNNGGNVNVSLSATAVIDVEAGTLAGSNSFEGIYTNNQASLNIASGATFDSVEGTIIVDALTGAGTLQGGYQAVGSVTLGVANGTGTFSGVLRDSGNNGGKLTLIKTGTGTETLSGTSSTYTGGTTVSAGRIVELNSGNALGVGTTSISSGAVLELSNTSTSATVSQVGGTTFSGAGSLQKTGAGTVQFGGSGNVNVSLSATAVIDVEAGTLVGSSSYDGIYTSNQASLNIASGATFNGVEGAVRVDALTGLGTLQSGYGTIGSVTIGVANGTGTFSGFLQDSGSNGGQLTLIKTGTGTQTLGGTSTYTGTTTINGGILRINNGGGTDPNKAGQLAGTSGITINNGGTLTFSGVTSASDRLNNAASVTINGGGILSTGNLSEGTAPTGAGGSGGVVGVGALTLAGASSSSAAALNFGAGASGSALVFSSLTASSKATYVNILNWTGTARADNGSTLNDRLLFATDPGFTTVDLAHWQFSDNHGSAFPTGGLEIAYDGYYEIVPVPEPASWLGGAMLLGAAGLTLRRQRARRF